MATAMGACTPPMEVAVRVVAGEEPNKRPRLICDTVFEPKLATRATPVDSLTATPIGPVPVGTSGTASALVKRFTMDAVPAALFATTAMPRCELTATPCGVAPMEMVCSTEPNVALDGLISMVEILLQPLLLTTAMGEKGPFLSWSAMATELGMGVAQATVMSTALMTRKSEALDWTPLLTTSRANLCGSDRKEAGMVAMISLLLTTCTFADGMGVPSRRTCAPAIKPEPKICTPAKSVAEVSAACGTKAPGIPPMTPGPGLGLGTTISVISADLKVPRLMTSICPGFVLPAVVLPDSTTKA